MHFSIFARLQEAALATASAAADPSPSFFWMLCM